MDVDGLSDGPDENQPGEVNAEYLSKSGWPEIEKDMQPSALLPGAMKCVQRHTKKLEALEPNYTVEKLTKVQTEFQPQPSAESTLKAPNFY